MRRCSEIIGIKMHGRGEGGVTMIETAVFLPLMLLIVFIILFLATLLNARSSLTAAVGSGARLGYTRAQVQMDANNNGTPEAMIGAVADWQKNGGSLAVAPQLLGLLSSTEFQSDGQSVEAFLNVLTAATFPGFAFKELPSTYIYAQIYALQAMRDSVGDVRFPCNPGDPTMPQTAHDGPGCLMCVPLRPPGSSGTYQGYDPDPAVFESLNRAGGFDTSWVGIRCSYRPSNAILGAVESLLGLLSGQAARSPMIISRSFFYDFPDA